MNQLGNAAGIQRDRLREADRGPLACSQRIAVGLPDRPGLRFGYAKPGELVALVRGAVAAVVGGGDYEAEQQSQFVGQSREPRNRLEIVPRRPAGPLGMGESVQAVDIDPEPLPAASRTLSKGRAQLIKRRGSGRLEQRSGS